MKILLIEDDLVLGDGIRAELTYQGFAVDWQKREENARAVLETDSFSLVILDIGLAQLSGVKFLRWLRQRKDSVPVLMLTALEDSGDKIAGPNLGADDFLIKPFELKELAARTRGLMRGARLPLGSQVAIGSLRLDLDSHGVYFDNEGIRLSQSEFIILRELMLNVGQILSRGHMERCLRGPASQIASNTVEVHIHNLRRKLGRNVVRTVRKAGYMVEERKTEAKRQEKQPSQATASA